MSDVMPSFGFLMSDVFRLMRRAFKEKMGEHSLTLAQAKALRHASYRQGVRQVELAELLEVQPITLARLIDQLEEAGLVERRRDAADRRAHLIYLTPAAAPELAAIEGAVQAIQQEALQGLSDRQAETVMMALTLMRDNLSK